VLGHVSGHGKDVARWIRVGAAAWIVMNGESSCMDKQEDVDLRNYPARERRKSRECRGVSTSVAMPATWPNTELVELSQSRRQECRKQNGKRM
jgi:hypothetical protein